MTRAALPSGSGRTAVFLPIDEGGPSLDLVLPLIHESRGTSTSPSQRRAIILAVVRHDRWGAVDIGGRVGLICFASWNHDRIRCFPPGCLAAGGTGRGGAQINSIRPPTRRGG